MIFMAFSHGFSHVILTQDCGEYIRRRVGKIALRSAVEAGGALAILPTRFGFSVVLRGQRRAVTVRDFEPSRRAFAHPTTPAANSRQSDAHSPSKSDSDSHYQNERSSL
jgi:hypothetical protein